MKIREYCVKAEKGVKINNHKLYDFINKFKYIMSCYIDYC